MSSTREYVRETRTVGAFTIRAYSILSTDWVAIDVYEANAGHSCTFRGDDERGVLGQYLSRPLPENIAALPFGEERTRLVGLWHRSLNVTAEDLIRTAFPEITFTGADIGNGHALVDLAEYHAQVQA